VVAVNGTTNDTIQSTTNGTSWTQRWTSSTLPAPEYLAFNGSYVAGIFYTYQAVLRSYASAAGGLGTWTTLNDVTNVNKQYTRGLWWDGTTSEWKTHYAHYTDTASHILSAAALPEDSWTVPAGTLSLGSTDVIAHLGDRPNGTPLVLAVYNSINRIESNGTMTNVRSSSGGVTSFARG
jgi:hypothetical protein